MYIEMENVIKKKKKKEEVYIDKCSSKITQKMHTHARTHARTHAHAHAHTHTHTHTVQTDGSEWQCGLTEIFWEQKCLELAFEGRESSRAPDVLGEIVPDVGAKVRESAKAKGFAGEALDFEHACVWRRVERAERNVKV